MPQKRSNSGRLGTAFVGLMLVGATAHAQSPDPTASLYAEPPQSATYFGDLLLRLDRAQHLPLGLPDEERAWLRVRAGLRWQVSDDWELGLAAKAAQGTNSARVVRLAHDNERINDLGLDQLYARWQWGESGSLLLGKAQLPLALGSMVWDDDLRPIGASATYAVDVGELNRLRLVGGYFAGDLLYGDDSRIAALQADLRIREGAATRGSIALSLLDFDRLESIAGSGLARSNRRAQGRLASDFRLVDLQLTGAAELWSVAFDARLDLVRNVGADDLNDGARFSLGAGDGTQTGQWRIEAAYQRVQRDAVLAAFSSEDWWFHSATRGALVSLGYRINETWRVQLSLFSDRADGRDIHTERALLDFRANW